MTAIRANTQDRDQEGAAGFRRADGARTNGRKDRGLGEKLESSSTWAFASPPVDLFAVQAMPRDPRAPDHDGPD